MLGFGRAPEPEHVRLRHGSSSPRGCWDAHLAGHAPYMGLGFFPEPMPSWELCSGYSLGVGLGLPRPSPFFLGPCCTLSSGYQA